VRFGLVAAGQCFGPRPPLERHTFVQPGFWLQFRDWEADWGFDERWFIAENDSAKIRRSWRERRTLSGSTSSQWRACAQRNFVVFQLPLPIARLRG
jgi:hypothetical protein